jgi:hypothetical protein
MKTATKNNKQTQKGNTHEQNNFTTYQQHYLDNGIQFVIIIKAV